MKFARCSNLSLTPRAVSCASYLSAINQLRPVGSQHHFLMVWPAGSALYFMVTPDAPVRLHRIRNDHLYHRYLGDPIEVLMLHENGTSEHAIVGPDLAAGQPVQLLIPGNTFQTARVVGQRRWFLDASTEWPRGRESRCRTRRCRRPGGEISRRGLRFAIVSARIAY
jgi:cupin superfamily protein DUF985